MSTPSNPTSGSKRPINGIVLGALGLLVVGAGLLMPQMLPDKKPPSPPPTELIPEGSKKDSAEKSPPPAWSDGPDARTLLMRLGVGTGVVLILCVVVLRFGRRWLTGMPGQSQPGSQFQLTETFSLGNRCFMHLVRVGKQQVLVGVDSAGMKSMIPLSAPFDSVVDDLENEDAAAVLTASRLPVLDRREQGHASRVSHEAGAAEPGGRN